MSEAKIEESQASVEGSSSIEESESQSISTISDSITRPSDSRGLDGSDFLTHLRAAGAFDSELKNEDTFGFNRKRNDRQNLESLSELFEASGPLSQVLQHISSNEDTIGHSNKTSTRQNTQPPPLNTLAALFEEPKPASTTAVPPAPSAPAPATPPVITTAPLPARSPSPLSPKSVLKKTIQSDAEGALSPRSGTSNESLLRNSTKGLPPRPQPLHQHNRSVSWGNNTRFAPSVAHHNNYQTPGPEEQSGGGRSDLESGASFDSVSSLGHDHHRRTNTRTQFTIEDLLGSTAPYEDEAESNIIRALEAQQAVKSHRAKTESCTSASLLGQVPESAVHDFTLEREDTGSSSLISSLNTPLSPPLSKDGSERTKLLNSSNQRKKAPRHRRHLSVEQTLVGLTHAMSALHGGSNESVKGHNLGDEPFSSANAFAANATRLSEQQDEGSLPSHIRRNTRGWRFDNLPMVEEDRRMVNSSGATTEGNDSSDGDIEAPSLSFSSGDGDKDDEDRDDEETNVDSTGATTRHSQRTRRQTILGDASDKLKAEWEAWRVFFSPRKENVRTYVKNIMLYILIPLTGVAMILFYFCGNPTTGTSTDGSSGDKASISWWLLFTVREVITFSMALAMQSLMVDFLSLGTKVMLRLAGPVVTLLIVQSKGWPFICFWWAIFDFAMLANGGRFAHHWLFWQDAIGLFNEENPSGNVPSSELHTTILIVAITVSVIVAVKRFVIGLYLGRQTFQHFGDKLAKLMNRMLLVTEVAGLAKDIEKSRISEDKIVPVASEAFGWDGDRLHGIPFSDDTISTPVRSVDGSSKMTLIDASSRDPLTGSLPAHEKAKLMQLLGQWEEPMRPSDPRQFEIATISSVLRFRKALTFIQKSYLFSYAFGPADTREHCIESAQTVFNRLLLRTPGKQVLEFETLALLALEDDDESVDQQKAKDLVKLFRPDRQGNLTMLDFVKSIDSLYREFRMLNASIQNSSQIDRAFENMFNVVFYAILVTIVLSLLGFNPLAMFLSLSSIILAFAFMIGSASSKYFEGVLFILVRRPYGIGDRIHISGVELDTSIEGSPGWVVENVTLFETIATWTPTKERCSLSNGSLASSRIINAARSPQAQFWVFLKFPIDAPYDKILIFKTAIEEYMNARPREWLALNGFRAHRIVADQGYVEYAIVIQHRESWQQIGQILDSKANLCSYCNEVAKQLNMHYRAPPLPVDLRYLNGDVDVTTTNLRAGGVTDNNPAPSEADREAQLKEFRQLALNKHNIRLN